MKVKMIGGVRHVEPSDPLCGLWLEPVAFPMEVLDYDLDSATHLELITLHDEVQLNAWAGTAFPDGYELWDMEVPAGAVPKAEDREDVRRREIADALASLSTAYDDPHATVLEALEEALAVIRTALRVDHISVDDFALARDRLTTLVRAAKQQGT